MSARSENFLLRRYIEKAMVDLPAMPTTVMRVVRAIEGGEASAAQIEKIITADAAITSKVLKTVNSPYFGMPRTISSVNQAIQILGLNQLRNVTLSIGVLNALNTTSPRIQALQQQCWEQSFASASAAHRIAVKKGLAKPQQEAVLIGGLLHDIGQLFLLTLFNIPYTEVQTRSKKQVAPLHEVERQVLGTTHANLGASLAERWSFPADLVEMIRDHDGDPTAETLNPTVACVHLADRIVNRIIEPESAEEIYPLDPRFAEWLNLSDAELTEIVEATMKDMEQAKVAASA